jgi:hypothetical protein
MNKYIIAGIKIELHLLFDTYFNSNLLSYASQFDDSANHVIEVIINQSPSIPTEAPKFLTPNRQIYEINGQEIILGVEAGTGKIRHKVTTDPQYKYTLIELNPNTGQDLAEIEYIWSGIVFLEIALLHGMTALHASALMLNGEAILFSGPSGMGKSTQANLWRKKFPTCITINDDKPLLHPTESGVEVYGTPWSGKDAINTNIEVKLKAIVFLGKAKNNNIKTLTKKEQVQEMVRNTYRPNHSELALKNLSLIDKMIGNTIIIGYDCTKNEDSVQMLYDFIYEGVHHED